MMISLRRSRILTGVPLLILAFLGLAWHRFGGNLRHPNTDPSQPLFTLPDSANTTANSSGPSATPHDPALIPFWDSLSKTVLDAKPPSTLPEDDIQAPVTRFSAVKKSTKRPDLLKLPQQDVDVLRDAHARYVARALELAPQLPFERGTQGIVTTAAGEYLPTLVVSLRMLRRTGSVMPMQVFVESRDVYEREICEGVLPPLNATCFLISDITDAVPQHVEISIPRFQLKVFAMLFSSFDEVLLLDSDCLVMERPEQLLSAEPFVSTGFVSWPDYWASTASPKYYEISSQTIPPLKTRAASESGQLLLSKSKHASTLLLSLYYNIYGLSHYYPLLSQGSVGQGDKETYLAAATSLNTSFYTVTTNIDELGYTYDDDKKFKGCGAAQLNAEDDYNKNILHNTSVKPHRYSFIHAQTYKMNAARVVDFFNDDINQRMWGPKEPMIEKFGRDVEKQLWAETLYTGCQLEHVFKDWQGKHWVCKNIGGVYKTLFD